RRRGWLRTSAGLAEASAAVTARRAEAASLRAGVLTTGRQHFNYLVQQRAVGERSAAYDAWSRFEEEVGELASAAQRAEEAGDRSRAHGRSRRAGLFGEAVRVLQVETTPEGLASRAEASSDGGDLVGAARFYERAGHQEKAAHHYQQASEFEAAARCWLRHL